MITGEVLNSVKYDPYAQMMRALPHMVDRARNAAVEKSASYRGFLVGAAVFAIDAGSARTDIFDSGNLKIRQDRDKVCAEKRAVRQAEKEGFSRIPLIVVAATTNRDEIAAVNIGNRRTPTLPPCGDCQDPRGHVAGSQLVTPDTLVFTTGLDPDEELFQANTLGQLQEAFQTGDERTLQEARSGFSFESAAETFNHFRVQDLNLPEIDRRPMGSLARLALLSQM